MYFLTSRCLASRWGFYEIVKIVETQHSIVMAPIENALRSESRERTHRRPPRGLVKVYDRVIEHPCLSRFLGADLSCRNAAWTGRLADIPIYGVRGIGHGSVGVIPSPTRHPRV